MALRVRNWERYQQYKDRCPPWIKLHREILQSEDWVMWSDSSRLLAIVCMLLASRTEDGTLPNNPEYIRRTAYLSKKPDLRPLITCGFLELDEDESEAYAMLSSCTTEERRVEESRGETEGAYPLDFEVFWLNYPLKKKKRDALKAWKQTKDIRPPAADLLAKLGALKASREWMKDGGQFIPHPATWLRADGWEDEVREPIPPASDPAAYSPLWSPADELVHGHKHALWSKYTEAMIDWQGAGERPGFDEWEKDS
jgi:hypothetical protein